VDPTKTFALSVPFATVDLRRNTTLWSFAAGDGTKPMWNGLDSRLLHLNGEPLMPTQIPCESQSTWAFTCSLQHVGSVLHKLNIVCCTCSYTLPPLEELGASTTLGDLKIAPLTINFLAVDGIEHCSHVR